MMGEKLSIEASGRLIICSCNVKLIDYLQSFQFFYLLFFILFTLGISIVILISSALSLASSLVIRTKNHIQSKKIRDGTRFSVNVTTFWVCIYGCIFIYRCTWSQKGGWRNNNLCVKLRCWDKRADRPTQRRPQVWGFLCYWNWVAIKEYIRNLYSSWECPVFNKNTRGRQR